MRFLENLLTDPKNCLIFLAMLAGLVMNHFKMFEPAPPRAG